MSVYMFTYMLFVYVFFVKVLKQDKFFFAVICSHNCINSSCPCSISSVKVPEDDIRYTVALTDVSGDGELSSSSTQARLTVRHNDDPINLRDTALEAFEGETLEIVVTRGGHASG